MKNINKRHITLILLATVLTSILCGCAALNDYIMTLRGELVGNDYVIYQYDNYGAPVFKVTGD